MDSNRLRFLMDELHISSRKLAKKTGISFSTITRLLLNSIQYRQDYIDKLCAFFSISSDFLLDQDKLGYYVFVDNEKLEISYDEAISFKDNISIKEMSLYNTDDTLPNTYIYRELSNNEFTEKVVLVEKIKKAVDSMKYYQLKDTLDFIDKYILK